MRLPLPSSASCALALLLFPLVSVSAYAAEKSTAPQLIAMAKSADPNLATAIAATLPAAALKAGTAWVGRGTQLFFAIDSAATPELVIDETPGPVMQRAGASGPGMPRPTFSPPAHCMRSTTRINGAKFGGSVDLPVFGPLSYLATGRSLGTRCWKDPARQQDLRRHGERILDLCAGAIRRRKTPAALMVFQDGGGYTRPRWRQSRAGRHRQPDRATENPGDDLRLHQARRHQRRRARRPTTSSKPTGRSGAARWATPCAARSTTPSPTATSASCVTRCSPTCAPSTTCARTLTAVRSPAFRRAASAPSTPRGRCPTSSAA